MVNLKNCSWPGSILFSERIQDPDLDSNEMDPISVYLLVPGDPPDDPSAGVQNPSPLPQYPKLK